MIRRRRVRARRGRIRPIVLDLEPRQLLAGFDLTTARPLNENDRIAAVATGSGGVELYRIDLDRTGEWVARLGSPSASARLSLLDRSGNVLIESMADPTRTTSGFIDESLAAGTYYVAVECSSAGAPYLLTTSFTATLVPNAPISTGAGALDVVAADFNQDGWIDLAAGDYLQNAMLIFFGAGNGTYQPPRTYPVGAGPCSAVAVDVNRDGLLDLITANQFSNDVSLLINHGDETFSTSLLGGVPADPFAIASGDLNGDGAVDLVVLGRLKAGMTVLLGRGDGTFGKPTWYDEGVSPGGVALADFNQDGRLDVVVTDTIGPSLRIQAGRGDGTFRASTILSTIAPVGSVVAADLDGDGSVDLAVGHASGQGLEIYYGRGDGTFGSPSQVATGEFVAAIVAKDFNADGRLDLAAACQGSGSISILIQQAKGVFRQDSVATAGTGPTGLTTADLDGDGRPDLVSANLNSRDLTLMYGLGEGTFRTAPTSSSQDQPTAIETGDFNRDGILDLVMAFGATDRITVSLGRLDGTFRSPIETPVGRNPYDLAVADFNGDGKLDVATANVTSDDISLLLGEGDGTFKPQSSLRASGWPVSVQTADMNEDGFLDLLSLNYLTGTVSVFLGQGDASFLNPTQVALASDDRSLTQFTVADYNGDGRLDIAASSRAASTIEVALAQGDGTYSAPMEWDSGCLPSQLGTGDLNRDGRTDLIVAGRRLDGESVLLFLAGRGDGTFEPPQLLLERSGGLAFIAADFTHNGQTDLILSDVSAQQVQILAFQNGAVLAPIQILNMTGDVSHLIANDVDGNGVLDLLAFDLEGRAVTVLAGQGNGLVAPGIPAALNQDDQPVFGDDVNGDGLEDLIVLHPNEDRLLIQLGHGDGTFRDLPPIPVGHLPRAVRGGDFNGDGRLDLAVTSSGDNQVRIMFGLGDGTFLEVQHLTVGIGPGPIVAEDFDRDGCLDLAITSVDSGTVTLLFGSRTGSFRVGQTYEVGTEPMALLLTDVNLDGNSDLVTANRSSQDVGILIGDGKGGFTPNRTALPGSAPNGLAPVEMDGDGRLEVVVSDELRAGIWVLAPSRSNGLQLKGFESLGISPTAHVEVDLNGDHIADVVAADAGSTVLTVYLSRSPGDYGTKIIRDIPFVISGLAVGDFNGDGRPDLVLSHAASGQVEVRLGVGDGTFLAPEAAYPHMVHTVGVVALGLQGSIAAYTIDVQGRMLIREKSTGVSTEFSPPHQVNQLPTEAIREVATVETSPEFISAYLNRHGTRIRVFAENLGGSEANPGPVLLQELALDPRLLASRLLAGDLNGDDRNDLVVLARGTDQVLVFFQADDGRFSTEPTTLKVGRGPTDAAIVDFDRDGRPDLVVANETSGDLSLFRTLPGGFGPETRIRAGIGMSVVTTILNQSVRQSQDGTVGVVSGDFNQDGWPDLLAINHDSNRLNVLLGTSGGSFVDPSSVTSYQTGEGPIQAVVARLDGNSNLDVAVLNSDSQNITVLLNNGTGQFTRRVTIPLGNQPTGLAARDVNGDGTTDLLVANVSGDLLVLLGRGDGTFVASNSYSAGEALAVGDLDGDGTPDVVISDVATDDLVVRFSRSGGFQQGHGDGLLAPGPVRIDDLNRDGLPDLIVVNSGANAIVVYLGVEPGQFDAPLSFTVGTNPQGLSITDMNRDGLPDLAVANAGSNDVSILMGSLQPSTSTWTLRSCPRLRAGTDPVDILVLDPDDDGADVLVVNRGDDSVLFISGFDNGFFNDRSPLRLPTGSRPIRAFVGGFDSLAGLDLVIVNSQSADLTFYSNFLDNNSHAFSIPSGGASPIAAVQGDYDGDNILDLAVAHAGTEVISILYGGPEGLRLAGTLRLSANAEPKGLAVAPAEGGMARLYVSTQTGSAILLLPVEFSVAAPDLGGGTDEHSSRATSGQGGASLAIGLTLAVTSNQLYLRDWSPIAQIMSVGAMSAAFSAVSALGTSIATLAAPYSIAIQPMTFVASSLATSLVAGLLDGERSQITDVLPLGPTDMAAVAVLMNVEAAPELAGRPGHEEEGNQETVHSLKIRSEGALIIPSTPLDRFISGADDRLKSATAELADALLEKPQPRSPDRQAQATDFDPPMGSAGSDLVEPNDSVEIDLPAAACPQPIENEPENADRPQPGSIVGLAAVLISWFRSRSPRVGQHSQGRHRGCVPLHDSLRLQKGRIDSTRDGRFKELPT